MIPDCQYGQTYNPLGWMTIIRSFTLSPISLVHALTFSRSLASGHVLFCKVETSSFLT
jgi:hypothetical protein